MFLKTFCWDWWIFLMSLVVAQSIIECFLLVWEFGCILEFYYTMIYWIVSERVSRFFIFSIWFLLFLFDVFTPSLFCMMIHTKICIRYYLNVILTDWQLSFTILVVNLIIFNKIYSILCILFVASSIASPIASMAVSSAKMATVASSCSCYFCIFPVIRCTCLKVECWLLKTNWCKGINYLLSVIGFIIFNKFFS